MMDNSGAMSKDRESDLENKISKSLRPLKVLHLIARMNRGGTARYVARLMQSPELSGLN